MNLIQLAMRKVYGKGTSEAAAQRRANREAAAFHDTHRSGEIIHMSRKTIYRVASDGSYRRIVPALQPAVNPPVSGWGAK